jgi:hypothetical protein
LEVADVNIFGIHFCHEELLFFVALLPFTGALVASLRARFHKNSWCSHSDTPYHYDEEEAGF